MSQHLHLLIEYRNGRAVRELVHAEALDEGRYRLLFSPGLVQGIGAGDEFKLLNDDGEFEVIRRAGNIVVQVHSTMPVDACRPALTKSVEAIGGRLDGSVEKGMVFTFPLASGFERIEALFAAFVAAAPGTEWTYGNVYDSNDGTTPLNWWVDKGGA